jgi:hypothetical protein
LRVSSWLYGPGRNIIRARTSTEYRQCVPNNNIGRNTRRKNESRVATIVRACPSSSAIIVRRPRALWSSGKPFFFFFLRGTRVRSNNVIIFFSAHREVYRTALRMRIAIRFCKAIRIVMCVATVEPDEKTRRAKKTAHTEFSVELRRR